MFARVNRYKDRSSTRGRLGSLLGFVIFSALTLILTGSAFIFWFDKTYSNELHAVLDHKPSTLTVLADDGRVILKKGVRHPDVQLSKVPQALINAVIATEDRRFYSHMGVDPIGLSRAVFSNFTGGRLRQGGSTITQQLVKNVFLNRNRTLTRKFRELVIAFWLERHYSKEFILQTYLNRVYFGAGASHGIEAAANRFFDSNTSALSLAQSALLAGLLKAPSYYSPEKNLARSQRRAAIVLSNMQATGAISKEEAAHARAHPATLIAPRPRNRKYTGVEYALDWAMEQLQKNVGRVETDIIVKTTLNYAWQIKAQKLVTQAIDENRVSRNIDQGAAVMLDATGGIKLMVGGANYRDSQFNRAAKARRQPGSSFKPIVYLAAMESGLTPNSIELDEPVKIEGWTPRNASRHYRGPVSLRQSLEKSINSVAVKLATKVGLHTVGLTAKRLGIRSKLTRHPSLALGSSEVTPLEMATAYTSFMNGGFKTSPHIIKEVTTSDGVPIYKGPAAYKARIIGKNYIYDMNDMLGAVVHTGTGQNAKLENHDAAGKTGTSQNYRDAWFLGYTGHFTCGVWTGNDDNSPTDKISGGKLPALIWKQIMEMAHVNRQRRSLPGLNGRFDAVPEAIIVSENLPAEDLIINPQDGEPLIAPADSDSVQ